MARRKRFTDEEIMQRVDSLDAVSATLLITSLVECLYGDESDEDWVGTLDAVAELLTHHGLAPE